MRVWLFDKIGPAHLYRIVQHGDGLTSEGIRYWNGEGTSEEPPPEGSVHDFVLWGLRGQCERAVRLGSLGTCRARYVVTPDWSVLLRTADAALADPPPQPIFSVDGPYLLLEAVDAGGYRQLRLAPPSVESKWSAGRRAADVMRAIDSMERRLAPVERNLRLWRGVTSGESRSAFRPCGIDEEWEFRGNLPHDAMPGRDGLFYVEVLGEVTPKWLARRWGAAFPRVLQSMGTRMARPWTGTECGDVEQAPPR